MTAYRDTIDKDIKIEVIGDLDEAKRFNLNKTITFGNKINLIIKRIIT